MAFERILVPVDFAAATEDIVHAGLSLHVGSKDIEFAPASAKALELAASVLAEAGEIRIVHATPALDHGKLYTGAAGLGNLTRAIEEIHKNAEQASLEVLRFLAEKHCAGKKLGFAAPHGSPLKVILDQSKAFDAQLIVLAASGRSRVERFFIGSTADRVIRQAGCPVLVIPPKQL